MRDQFENWLMYQINFITPPSRYVDYYDDDKAVAYADGYDAAVTEMRDELKCLVADFSTNLEIVCASGLLDLDVDVNAVADYVQTNDCYLQPETAHNAMQLTQILRQGLGLPPLADASIAQTAISNPDRILANSPAPELS